MITFMVIVIVITVTVIVIITIKQHKLFSKTLENIRATLSVFEDFRR